MKNHKKIKELKQELVELYEQGVTSIYPYGNRVQIREEVFKENFTEYNSKTHGSTDIELFVEFDGIVYFALEEVE